MHPTLSLFRPTRCVIGVIVAALTNAKADSICVNVVFTITFIFTGSVLKHVSQQLKLGWAENLMVLNIPSLVFRAFRKLSSVAFLEKCNFTYFYHPHLYQSLKRHLRYNRKEIICLWSNG
mmetsp:Transcript_22441/g.33232  ORF Transcript_22441/g.33232 Transcript_22441/m.33232 type:complete len:120 (-) Transcript_22441:288-647(-)